MKNFNIILAFAMILLALPFVNSLALCQNINTLDAIPCLIQTPVLACSTYAIVHNLNTTQYFNVNMNAVGDGTYSFAFNFPIDDYQIILCDNTSTTLTVIASTSTPSLPSYVPNAPSNNTGSSFNFADNNLNGSVTFTQYPYVDVNTTETLYVGIFNQTGAVNNLNVTMFLTEPNGSIDIIPVYFSVPLNIYTVGLVFSNVGDYPFRIDVNGTIINQTLTRGTLLVRQPFFVRVKLFNSGDKTAYKDNAGVITAEFKGSQKIDAGLENFFHPIAVTSVYYKPAFHAQYIDGTATLKLYDDTTYLFRYYSGDITFPTRYSVPNVTVFSGENVYLGEQKLNVSSSGTLIQYLLSNKDLHQYGWLMNMILIIIFAFVVIGCLGIFFMMPDKAHIALIFGVILIGTLILIRIVAFLLWGQ